MATGDHVNDVKIIAQRSRSDELMIRFNVSWVAEISARIKAKTQREDVESFARTSLEYQPAQKLLTLCLPLFQCAQKATTVAIEHYHSALEPLMVSQNPPRGRKAKQAKL